MIRYTEEGQDNRKKRLEYLRKRVASIRNLNSYKESSEWKDLKKIIEDFIETEKNAQKMAIIACSIGGKFDPIEGGVKKETDSRLVSDCRVAYEREQAFQLVINLVEKTDEQIREIENTISQLEKTYKEAKEMLS